MFLKCFYIAHLNQNGRPLGRIMRYHSNIVLGHKQQRCMLIFRLVNAATFGVVVLAIAGNAGAHERSMCILADLIAGAMHIAFVEVCLKGKYISNIH